MLIEPKQELTLVGREFGVTQRARARQTEIDRDSMESTRMEQRKVKGE
jgi:hypothetical protein